MTVVQFINSVPEMAEQAWSTFAGVTTINGKLDSKTLWSSIQAVHGKADKSERRGTDRYFGNILVQVDPTEPGFVQLTDMA